MPKSRKAESTKIPKRLLSSVERAWGELDKEMGSIEMVYLRFHLDDTNFDPNDWTEKEWRQMQKAEIKALRQHWDRLTAKFSAYTEAIDALDEVLQEQEL
jgi:hypothetical protein